jgi:hypothetical protein
MTVIKKKGKWEFGYKDTYSLNTTLNPIILAGLQKFHDILEQRNKTGKTIGVPNEYMKKEEEWITDSDVQDWLDDLKKMMYAFDGSKGPDISKYNFHMNMIPVEGGVAKEGMSVPYTIEPTDEEASDRYHADCKAHEDKVKEGLKLFSDKYSDLWW